MGVTSSTPMNLVVGAGNVLKGSPLADLGASEAINTFTITRVYYTPALNGVPGALLGTDYLQSEDAKLETQLPEISAATLAALWPGSAPASVGGGTEIRYNGAPRMAEAAYDDWELQVPGLTNLFGFFIENGVNLGSIAAAADDKADMSPKMEIHSRWDPADMTVSPHGFRITPLGS